MASRFDVFRSWVRTAAEAGKERIGEMRSVSNVKRAIEELRERRASISEAALSSAIAHCPGASASSVSLQDGRIVCDITFDDGRSLVFAVIPEKARFAPRGAKEVIFTVEPPEMVNEARTRDAVGCIAALIARGLWGPMLGPRDGDEQALVEREGARLRADLRTVPAVRAALEGSPAAMALEVLGIESFAVEERTLRLKIALPLPPM
jgi:hypothetical protein